MAAKIIVVWGKNGSGKTTTAINLACALAERDCTVGIIPSNLYYGEIQALLDCEIPTNKGLHKALDENCININENYTMCGFKKDIYTLTLPIDFDCLLNSEVTSEQITKLIEKSEPYFQYIIIDGSSDIQNGMTFLAMAQAKIIFNIYKPSITTSLWNNNMNNLIEKINIGERIIPVLNNDDNTIDKKIFMKQTGLKFNDELVHVDVAALCENSSSPIFYQKDKKSKLYASAINKLADLCEGVR